MQKRVEGKKRNPATEKTGRMKKKNLEENFFICVECAINQRNVFIPKLGMYTSLIHP